MSEFMHTLNFDTEEGVYLHGFDHEVWRPSLPYPLFVGWGSKAKCECGRVFKNLEAYREHYVYMAVWQNESGYISRLVSENRRMIEAVVGEKLEAQGQNGWWNHSPYRRGIYNGIETAFAAIQGRVPKLRAAPKRYETTDRKSRARRKRSPGKVVK